MAALYFLSKLSLFGDLTLDLTVGREKKEKKNAKKKKKLKRKYLICFGLLTQTFTLT